jgi:flagellar protein FliO/FliZ
MPFPSLSRAATVALPLILTFPASALAAPGSTATTGETTPLSLPAQPSKLDVAGSGSGGSLVRTFVGLAIVIAVIYGIAWVLRQMKASRDEKSTGRGLSSAATLPLASGRSLHLVRAGSEFVLVGVAENAVTALRTYSEQEAEELGLMPDDSPGDGARLTAVGRVREFPEQLSGFASALREKTNDLREKTVRK